jgi:hypothetical protein
MSSPTSSSKHTARDLLWRKELAPSATPQPVDHPAAPQHTVRETIWRKEPASGATPSTSEAKKEKNNGK